jgi:hypothetical protein
MKHRTAGVTARQPAREELLREHFDTLAALFDPASKRERRSTR